jgi:hypothetical protein
LTPNPNLVKSAYNLQIVSFNNRELPEKRNKERKDRV